MPWHRPFSSASNSGAHLVFSSSVTGNAFSIGSISASLNILLNNDTGNPIALSLVGANSATYSGQFSGQGELE